MELNESAISPAAEARVRNAVETAAIDREWEPELYELLNEYDRRATEIEQRRAALCRALAIPDHTPWEAALESARSAGVVRDAEYRTRDRVEAENTRLRAALDAVDGPVLDGVHVPRVPERPDDVVERIVAAGLRQRVDLLEARAALAASGGTAAPTDEQVADALREWHDLTANQRATWDRLRPRWSLAAFIGHHLRVALAARTPQPADGYHPNGWCTPARLVLLWLASLDKESMAQARRMVTLDDIIAKAQEALAFSRARTPQPAPSDPQETP